MYFQYTSVFYKKTQQINSNQVLEVKLYSFHKYKYFISIKGSRNSFDNYKVIISKYNLLIIISKYNLEHHSVLLCKQMGIYTTLIPGNSLFMNAV